MVTFSKNLGSAFQSALQAIAGSVVGAALGILTIALLAGLSTGFSYMSHPVTMVRRCVSLRTVERRHTWTYPAALYVCTPDSVLSNHAQVLETTSGNANSSEELAFETWRLLDVPLTRSGSTPAPAPVQSVWVCVLVSIVGFLLALNKERFPKLEVGFSIALLTYPIVTIPGKPPCSP